MELVYVAVTATVLAQRHKLAAVAAVCCMALQ
jgi:hypothetical protein